MVFTPPPPPVPHQLINSAGHNMKLGHGAGATTYYCGRNRVNTPSGNCGPASGHQCSACYAVAPSSMFGPPLPFIPPDQLFNSEGYEMRLGRYAGATTYYCRRLGVDTPTGQCGPHSGLQCSACYAVAPSAVFRPPSPPAPVLNRDGVEMKLGWGAGEDTYYCGRLRMNTPTGQCGPYMGPQCAACYAVAPAYF